jgi:hypothetical protein
LGMVDVSLTAYDVMRSVRVTTAALVKKRCGIDETAMAAAVSTHCGRKEGDGIVWELVRVRERAGRRCVPEDNIDVRVALLMSVEEREPLRRNDNEAVLV